MEPTTDELRHALLTSALGVNSVRLDYARERVRRAQEALASLEAERAEIQELLREMVDKPPTLP